MTQGQELAGDLADADSGDPNHARECRSDFEREYQPWYSEAAATIQQLLPMRHDEFVAMYEPVLGRDKLDLDTYRIRDWILGIRPGTHPRAQRPLFDALQAASSQFHLQLGILEAATSRLESSLFDIQKLTSAQVFDSALDATRELLECGFVRAGGVIAGVVLEKHLAQVCDDRAIAITNDKPTLADFNEALKKVNIIDVPVWRRISHFADIRNLCGHNKHREPTKDEVEDLVNGVDNLIKTLS